ncbi:hypothetical protein ACOMHN_063218 [Nucella lapillus]
MEFTFTKRNKRKLHEGYAYVMDCTKADNVTIFWRCEKRGECKGRLKTVNDVLEGRPSTHSHPPSAARCLALKVVGDIKQRAEQSEEATSSIINNCTAEFPLAAAGSLPKKETLARMIRRKRKAPDSDIISEELKLTTRGEQFLAFQTDDIVILTTPSNLDVLARNAHWFCDGTFDSAPLATQLYTIHVLVEDTHTLPLVYCVTKNKNRATYDVIFTYLNGQRDLNPETITIDFEPAALNSISEHFPTTCTGAFFTLANVFGETSSRLDYKIANVCHAPNTWQACQQVTQGAGKHQLMLEQRAMGVRMRKNKQYEVVNTRLQALVARYAQEDVLVFLKAVAHNL